MISFFEVQGVYLALYWQNMLKNQEVEIPLGFVGKFPGEFTGPACRVYEYYNPENEVWMKGLTAIVMKGSSSFVFKSK